MADTDKKPSAIMSWKVMVVVVLAMIGAIALAMLLIPQLSLNAARRGATIAISLFLAQQIGLRLAWRKKRQSGD